MKDPADTDDQLLSALLAVTTASGLDAESVDGVVQLTAGASRRTLIFDAISADGERTPLVVQVSVGADALAIVDTPAEAALLERADAAGVTVPGFVGSGDNDGLGGPWILTRAVAGETIARRILRDDEFATARERLVGQCGRELAVIHSVEVGDLDLVDLDDPVADLRARYDGFDQPRAAFEMGFVWLEDNRPDPVEPTLVHGDFRLGNLIVAEAGLSAILDWELAHRGDPAEDLAWLCVRAWRFGGADPVAGIGSREELLGAYRAAGGREMDLERLAWWEVYGTLRWGVICMQQAGRHRSGETRSVELAAIGRRICENEYEILELVT
ncbi:MAG: phosphotransferase family protein [Acidimicrobiales bacterium]